jgi:hypothetical protein
MTIYQTLMTKYQRLLTNDYQISTNSYVRIYKQIMQNKPKVKSAKMNVNTFVTSNYVHVGQLVIQTNKAKTNPIQTQFHERSKMNSFAPIRSFTLILIMLLVEFTTLKGANFYIIDRVYCL